MNTGRRQARKLMVLTPPRKGTIKFSGWRFAECNTQYYNSNSIYESLLMVELHISFNERRWRWKGWRLKLSPICYPPPPRKFLATGEAWMNKQLCDTVISKLSIAHFIHIMSLSIWSSVLSLSNRIRTGDIKHKHMLVYHNITAWIRQF